MDARLFKVSDEGGCNGVGGEEGRRFRGSFWREHRMQRFQALRDGEGQLTSKLSNDATHLVEPDVCIQLVHVLAQLLIRLVRALNPLPIRMHIPHKLRQVDHAAQ